MQVANPNNIKIYNLSAGKSLPEWLSDRKKRSLQKEDGELRRRIELIQDFDMPTVSNYIAVTKDQQYIFACGIYKPRIRCYDVNNLSMKFERCYDAEAVKFHILSDDYTKLVILENDRNVEIHSQHGKWYKFRIPKYGRDLDYHTSSCDMYLVGASPEIYRFNLERGSFMQSLKTDATEIYCCQFNPHHELFACGTNEGRVECWDPRTKTKAGTLDCAPHVLSENPGTVKIPGITALKFRDALTFGVGTTTGQVLLYDIRSNKPLLLKDHNYDLPIKTLQFHDQSDLVLSADSRILKIWERETGKAFTSIEPESKINNMCLFPDSGLLFLANEAPKMLTYYIPALGAAPKWCSFLDSLTEELEENNDTSVYDDYKFVTRQELDSLGMTNLIGSKLLRAYMHGYFMDVRLYHKAKSITQPFAYSEYRKSKIRERIEEERKRGVKVKKLPKVNRQFAEKLMEQSEGDEIKKKKKMEAKNLLGDNRFAAMFQRPEFQVDTESEEYKLLNPLVSQMDKARQKKAMKERLKELEGEMDREEESPEDDSSDDEHTWTAEVKKKYKEIQHESKIRRRQEMMEARLKPQFFELNSVKTSGKSEDRGEKLRRKVMKKSLGERLVSDQDRSGVIRQSGSATGSMEMTFELKKNKREDNFRQQSIVHHKERKKLRRSAGALKKDQPKGLQTKFWMGKRVT